MSYQVETKHRSQGITLIALAITIIVLLILAGVTIASLNGENGIIKNAQKAKELTEKSEKNEINKLDEQETILLEAKGEKYVTNGLLLHYDAIYNDETKHNDLTNVWKDISGNHKDGILQGFAPGNWTKNTLHFNQDGAYVELPIEGEYENLTVEIVARKLTRSINFGFHFSEEKLQDNRKFSIHLPWTDQKIYFDTNSESSFPERATMDIENLIDEQASNVFVFTKSTTEGQSIYINGKKENQDTSLKTKIGEIKYATIGSNPNLIVQEYEGWSANFRGEVYAFRVYNRSLTKEEIRNNYLLDRAKFNF